MALRRGRVQHQQQGANPTNAFQTAEALRRADAGEPGAYALARILTPLIKFRACRDARKVTGDAMEVRGGCGYIEEWSDPRLVRDAHLGSIWEGTSNIVALDVQETQRWRRTGVGRWRCGAGSGAACWNGHEKSRPRMIRSRPLQALAWGQAATAAPRRRRAAAGGVEGAP